jgi:hypothetical protein
VRERLAPAGLGDDGEIADPWGIRERFVSA